MCKDAGMDGCLQARREKLRLKMYELAWKLKRAEALGRCKRLKKLEEVEKIDTVMGQDGGRVRGQVGNIKAELGMEVEVEVEVQKHLEEMN
jgi:hypothetical protein